MISHKANASNGIRIYFQSLLSITAILIAVFKFLTCQAVLADEPPEKAELNPRERIIGIWEQVQAIDNGKTVVLDSNPFYAFRRDGIYCSRSTAKSKVILTGRYTIDTSTTPWRIDMFVRSEILMGRLAGVFGIEGDNLVLSLNHKDVQNEQTVVPHATDFEARKPNDKLAREGIMHILYRFTRCLPEKDPELLYGELKTVRIGKGDELEKGIGKGDGGQFEYEIKVEHDAE